MKNLGEVKKPLEFDTFETAEEGDVAEEPAPVETTNDEEPMEASPSDDAPTNEQKPKTLPPKEDEYVWAWKVCFEFHVIVCLTLMMLLVLFSPSWKLQDVHSSSNIF